MRNKPRVSWELAFDHRPGALRWKLSGVMQDGKIWAEYLFATRPSRKVLAHTRKAKRDAILRLYM